MVKVACLINDGQTLDGVFAGGYFTEGQEVHLNPDIAKFYEDGGVLTVIGAAEQTAQVDALIEDVLTEFGG